MPIVCFDEHFSPILIDFDFCQRDLEKTTIDDIKIFVKDVITCMNDQLPQDIEKIKMLFYMRCKMENMIVKIKLFRIRSHERW